MAQQDIQQAFVEGIYEIYSIMFTDGEEDGIELSFLDESGTKVDSVYRESKNKKYEEPIILCGRATLSPEKSEDIIHDVEYDAVFKFPYKSFLDHDIDVSIAGLERLRKAKLTFHGKDYNVFNIIPTTFVENVFLVYEFRCTEV